MSLIVLLAVLTVVGLVTMAVFLLRVLCGSRLWSVRAFSLGRVRMIIVIDLRIVNVIDAFRLGILCRFGILSDTLSQELAKLSII